MNKGFITEFIIIICSVIAFIGILFSIAFIRFSSTGKGQHTGFVTAVEQEGYIFRNYRIYVKTDNSSSQEDKYCMDRNKIDLANKAKEWSKNRQLVEVSFEGVRGMGAGLCNDIEIINIELLK